MRGSDDFFHSRIDQMIDLRHPLAVLASHMAGARQGRYPMSHGAIAVLC